MSCTPRRRRLSGFSALLTLTLLGTLLLPVGPAAAVPGATSTVFVNELHYDNTGTDTGEFVEVAGPAGTNLSGWTVALYNGANGATYGTAAPLPTPIPDQQNGYGTVSVSYPSNGLQNGAPDGLALVNNGQIVQFLSYEGAFAAVGGPADGQTGTDIGVRQAGTEPAGSSLQLAGSGGSYGEFTWEATTAGTPGAPNTGQTFAQPGNAAPTIACPDDVVLDAGTATSREVTSTDPDGRVDSITVDTVDPATTTIMVGSTTPQSGTTPASATLTVDEATAPGSYEVVLQASNDDTEPQTVTCAFTVTLVSDEPVLISAIQGAGHTSPREGDLVVVEAVVVGDFQGDAQGNQLGGFFLQEQDSQADADAATSEGIFVFDPDAADMSPGDLVSVTGTVTEFNGLTEITDVSAVTTRSTGNPLPTAATLSLPVADRSDLEAFEGMRVTVPGELFVTENYQLGRFGELRLAHGGVLPQGTNVAEPGEPARAVEASNDSREILLDDGRTVQNPEPVPYLGSADDPRGRIGDVTTDLSGVLSFGFSQYRIQPTGDVAFTPSRSRPLQPPAVGGELRAASFNVLNYFDAPFPSARGADNQEEFDRQEAKIVEAVLGLDADVVGLIELENGNAADEATPAQQVLAEALNAEAGAGVYDFIDTGVIGGDAIRQGFLYQPAAVKPVGRFAVLDDVDPFTRNSRPPLAQRFRDTDTGATFIAVVNHLKSKGCRGASGANADQGDGQGCYNADRVLGAQALRDWIATDRYFTKESDVLIIGDLNAYAKEDPIDALTDAGYVNLIERFNGDDGYSYTFDGRQGYLDHALASPSLLAQITGAAEWHVNADEPLLLDYNTEFNPAGAYRADAFRSSDHDPVVVGLGEGARRPRDRRTGLG